MNWRLSDHSGGNDKSAAGVGCCGQQTIQRDGSEDSDTGHSEAEDVCEE